jgi:hypothetical protein
MTPSEITKIIEREINGNWELSNWHGCDLKKCLVRPTKKFYSDGLDTEIKHELWIVLEELPETLEGYKVVFDEKTRNFGLAMSSTNGDYYLGRYGTFLEAFKSM